MGTCEMSEFEAEKEELSAEIQRMADIEKKVYAEGIPFAIDGVDLTELDPETIVLVNAILRADRRRIYNEHAIELEQGENQRDELATY